MKEDNESDESVADSDGSVLDSLEEDKDGEPTHVNTRGTKIMICEDSSNDDEPNFKVEGRSKGRKKSKWTAEIASDTGV